MSNNTKKKRRAGASSDREDNNGLLVHDHMTNLIQTLVDSNRTQMAMMSSMQGEIKGLKGEITRLTNESNQMKQVISAMHRTQKVNNDTANQMNQTINAMQTAQTTISQNMNSQFDDVHNKLNYHEALLRNQKWKYSAPRPSEEYWDGVGEVEDVAAESFLTQIKKSTEEMRYGTGDGKEIFIYAVLPYNEEFLPHWKEYANALEQHQYRLKCLPKDTDTKLHLCDMELPNEVVEVLSKALESTHVTNFILGNNSLGQSGIDFALKYVKSNCILKVFSLYDNPIECMKDIKQLCQIVEEHPSIEELYLDGCRGEGVNGYEILQMIMNAGKNKLKWVDLTNNSISTGGNTFISDFLAGNPILECLDLSGNALDDNDAIAIAGALKQNKKLRTLDITNNNISRLGWAALGKVEFDDTSLNSAADSNHRCTIKYPSGEDDEIQGLDTREMNGNSEYNFDPSCIRKRKVYSVLSVRNRQRFNVGHFDDVPVELLPDMLSTIQQYSQYHTESSEMSQDTNDVNPLSLVFEVCRYWEKSLAVYELLSS